MSPVRQPGCVMASTPDRQRPRPAGQRFVRRYNQARIGLALLVVSLVLAAVSGMRPGWSIALAVLSIGVGWGLAARGVLCPHCGESAVRLGDGPLLGGPPARCARCGQTLAGEGAGDGDADPEPGPGRRPGDG